MSRCRSTVAMTFTCIALLAAWPAGGLRATSDVTRLTVGAEEVRIARDGFGVPHIFAKTTRGLFEAYGYAVAQDRLWQLELNRRAAYGRLAEIAGPPLVPADTFVRVTGYTEAELDAQLAVVDERTREILAAYAAGINRYVNEVVASDPLALPFEFHALGIFPAPWTVRDCIAFGVFMARRFGESGGREIANQLLLQGLIGMHGPEGAAQIFDDVRWINDPDAPTTIPRGESAQRRLEPRVDPHAYQLRHAGNLQTYVGDLQIHVSPERAAAGWSSMGVPNRLGSYGWVVGASRSVEGVPLLYGGPQLGFGAPEVLHEVQLTSEEGLDVVGMAFAGAPPVLIGHNKHLAWTATTAIGDTVDHYIETLCDAGGGEGPGYVFRGTCTPFDARVETIAVRGDAPVSVTVQRSVHGPVVGGAPGIAVTQKRAHWGRELAAVSAFLDLDHAWNIWQFGSAVRQIVMSLNFLYADTAGNIAYWQAGQIPLRPDGFDTRLPFPGDGSAEWPSGFVKIPVSINPRQGWLTNWNNKPSVDYNNSDSHVLGKQFRVLDIEDRLRRRRISLETMRDIPKDIGRVKGLGREARFLKPYLLSALDRMPASHPLAGPARAIIETWDGNGIEDVLTSTQATAGEVIFTTWLELMLQNTFGDELGPFVSEATSNTLIHALDFAFTGSSGVPPSRDYFNGVAPDAVIVSTFDEAVARLANTQGDAPERWTASRGEFVLAHPLLGPVATIPGSNRATYGLIVALKRPRPSAESVYTLGQSGFIRLIPGGGFQFDEHFMDQLDLFRNFAYKPLPLLRNVRH